MYVLPFHSLQYIYPSSWVGFHLARDEELRQQGLRGI